MLSDEYQSMAANAICHEANMASLAWQHVAAAYERPCAMFRPVLSIDGNKWCALYGSNIQDGVAGFGDSPAEAMYDFDQAWHQKLAAADQRQPMTEADVRHLIYEHTKLNPNQRDDQESIDYIVNAVRAVERHHGITATDKESK